MNKIIEKVAKDKRPKDGFVCIKCPFSAWHNGTVEFDNYDVKHTEDAIGEEEFLDCYCHKTHTYTFDSTKRRTTYLSKENKTIVVYKHMTDCGDLQMAINEVLGGK